ncbi:mannose-6-phosphate isomerase, class I [Aliagarivorans marinus]|uniref:mannose-6-phosphate isomerase, class I n=1 Tax=Aliagarivorans marinus TaxID=561965 RepID=UPI0003FE651E|nr:mannose-6-phosphate isomerase, class I [Aliagarivorans marinus]
MTTTLYKLDNCIQHYQWGSPTAFSEMFGLSNEAQQPQAEIWMGAHPKGSSQLSGSPLKLSELIDQSPKSVLGDYTYQRFGELPYLFKVLAAAKPLSIQVHPNRHKAQAGYRVENQRGIALDAANRNYKDANHKPELVYALTPYTAMNGFRPIEQILLLFKQAAINALQAERDALLANPTATGLKAFFAAVMNLKGAHKQQVLNQLKQGHLQAAQGPLAQAAHRLIERFRDEYPDDIGLLSPLLLNVVELAPGEAMFLHAETPHAYVQGVALEIMANSDNVLRAGLTPKYIDVDELIANTRFVPIPPDTLKLASYQQDNKRCYPVPVDDFGFEVLTVDPQGHQQYLRGAEILFCIEGEVSICAGQQLLTLSAGESAFVCESAKVYRYQGRGTLARAFN